MAGINTARVVLGGILAGVVVNIGEYLLNEVILQAQMRAALERLNLAPVTGGALVVFLLIGFILGLAMLWVYAAIRPRFGPGPKTAVYAGLAAWLLAYFCPGLGYMAMGLFPASLIVFGLVWGLIELPLAAVIGAWIYQEAPRPAAVGA
ncbi:MAG TPA: hypothetical protein VNI83_03725 [Vicinamibacterales bacterium]|nr:hypothetical protein [Vicinamibacterales bacterium]